MLAYDGRGRDMKRSSSVAPRDERGSVLVLFSAALFTLILVVVLVVEVANWFEHKRHLQLQADAAALAGGAAFQLTGCDNSGIYTAVRNYAGVKDATHLNPYNQQVGGTLASNAHVLVNATKFWPDGGTDYSDGGQPCATKFVDVKMTESSLKSFFLDPSFLVPAINARARVTLKLVNALSGQLPIGVPDVNPLSGAVVFYDEDSPGTLSTTYARYLRKIGTAGGLN